MQISLEKIVTHANERLAIGGEAKDHEAWVERFRRFLKLEGERLKSRHRFGLGGGEIAGGRSHLIDVVVCRVCDVAASDLAPRDAELNDFALVALGGYGRRELAPYSDIDILLLHAGRRSKGLKQFTERVLYLLWDMGLTVGHSFRSVSECVEMAASDLHSRNAMAEARLVTGNAHLFRRLNRELDDAVFKNKRHTNAFLRRMTDELEARYEKFGKTVCLQEPNVKESAGGLRDLHSAVWVGNAIFGSKSLDDLRADDHVSGAEYSTARRAYDFIMRVRNEAHFSTGRRTDLLTLDLQPLIASNLGYAPRRGLLASERLMLDYYRRARELHQFCETFLVRALESRNEKRRRAKGFRPSFELRQGNLYLSIVRGAASKDSSTGGLEIRGGRICSKNGALDFGGDPMRLMQVFQMSQAEEAPLASEVKLAIRNNLSLADRRFRSSKPASRALMEILRPKGRVSGALREMHDTGFLARLLPEFGHITFLVQHDFYHKYTIDEHLLKAVEALDLLWMHHDQKLSHFARVFAEIEDAAPLYLGLLLHDIGKGRGKGHVARGVRIAERVCERLRLERTIADSVIFLVRQHLLMSHTAQRRDTADEDLLEEFVTTVGSLDRLNILLLLTYADIRAVGPEVWTDWKGTLLWDLYARARSHFTGGRPVRWDTHHKMSVKQQVIRELLPRYMPSDVWKHFAMMPERYLRATDPDQMVRHFRLIDQMRDEPLVVEWRVPEGNHCTELTVCTHDRQGLFAQLAGALTASGINILSADVYTREDGIVVDTFKVCETSGSHSVKPQRSAKAEQNLKAAIHWQYDVSAAVEQWRAKLPRRRRLIPRGDTQPKVRFNSEASATNTVIEVQAEDEPGLAYKLANTLAGLSVNIMLAKITTEKSLALDIFYVTDASGRKLDENQMSEVGAALMSALAGPTKEPL